jgi:hypothetical protein
MEECQNNVLGFKGACEPITSPKKFIAKTYTPVAAGYWRLTRPDSCHLQEVQRFRAARCCHEDWLLAAGQRPAVTETFTDNIPIIRSIAFHLHCIAYAWWVSPLPSNGVCASAIVLIHPKSTRIQVRGRTKRPCCLSETFLSRPFH